MNIRRQSTEDRRYYYCGFYLKKKEPFYQPFLHENPAKPVNGIQEIFNFIWSAHAKKYSETHPLSITPNWR